IRRDLLRHSPGHEARGPGPSGKFYGGSPSRRPCLRLSAGTSGKPSAHELPRSGPQGIVTVKDRLREPQELRPERAAGDLEQQHRVERPPAPLGRRARVEEPDALVLLAD